MKAALTPALALELMQKGLSPSKAAKILQSQDADKSNAVCLRRVHQLCKDGRLGYTVEGRYLIHPQELENLTLNERGCPVGLDEALPLSYVAETAGESVLGLQKMIAEGIVGHRTRKGKYVITRRDLLRYLSGFRTSYWLETVPVKLVAKKARTSETAVKKMLKSGSLGREVDGERVITRGDLADYLELVQSEVN